MLIITNNPKKYAQELKDGHDVFWACSLNTGAQWIMAKHPERGYLHHSVLNNTASGECTILGYGPSRTKFSRAKFKGPVFAINRSIDLCPDAEYWACHDRDMIVEHYNTRPKGSTLLTQGANGIYDDFVEASSHMRIVMIDAEPIPTRWPEGERPLYWNETTFGWLLHLAIRMGFDTIRTVGIDLTEGGYQHPRIEYEELCRQHAGVRERTLFMFTPSEKREWYERPVRIIDYSGGELPVEKASV